MRLESHVVIPYKHVFMNTRANQIKLGVGLLTAAFGLMVLWVAGHFIAGLYIQLLWFGAIGYKDVLITILRARFLIGAVFFIVSCLAFYGNMVLALRVPLGRPPQLPFVAEPERVVRIVRPLSVAVALFMGLMVAFPAASNWVEFVNFVYSESFGIEDPVFHHDVSFYVFVMPAIAYVRKIAFVAVLLCLLLSALIYYLRGAFNFEEPVNLVPDWPFAHISVLTGTAALLLAGQFWIARYAVLYTKEGAVFGADYTDIHARLPVYVLLTVLSVLAAGWFFVNARLKRRSVNVLVVIGFALFWFAAAGIYPFIVQSFVVDPNEYACEKQYIARSIYYTRAAYQLDTVDAHPWQGDGVVTEETLAAHPGTAENLQIWDPAPLLDMYNQKQRIRGYYGFRNIDVDRYEIAGALEPVMIAPRELAHQLLPEKSRVWTNLHLQYTHGYGFCMSFGDRLAQEGLPEFLVSNIPPETSYDVTVAEPRVYYGEETGLYALTQTRLNEFDYPGDPENHFNRYEGSGGVPVGGRLRRAVLSWYLGDIDILLTSQFTPESKILLFRRVQERVRKVAPFLDFDQDPYPVLFEGRLIWILDGYTLTRRFPYSESIGKANYWRNSVKATVDAYDGTVTLYRMDMDDPVLRVFAKVFPDLFRSLDEMPEGLRSHLRYPKDMFMVQSVIYCRYHVEDPKVFFNGEDVWTFPRGTQGGVDVVEPPRYMVMKVPYSNRPAEFVLTRTFTVEGKDNMIAWLAGGCDGPNYGKLTLLRLSKDRNIYGPNQAKGRFNQDPEVSAFTTLMGQIGSEVVQSKVLAIPIEDGLLYLQSLYVVDPDVKLPELKQIVVGHNDRVAMAPTVGEALDELFAGRGARQTETIVPLAAPEEQAAVRFYNQARECLRTGDWAGFGDAFEALGRELGIVDEEGSEGEP
jgi:uncharacterized protein